MYCGECNANLGPMRPTDKENNQIVIDHFKKAGHDVSELAEARDLLIMCLRYSAFSSSAVVDALEMVLKAAETEGFEAGYLHAQETVGDWNRP